MVCNPFAIFGPTLVGDQLRFRGPDSMLISGAVEAEKDDRSWREWLTKYGLYDPHLSDVAARLRYDKLHKVTFPEAPENEWPGCYRDLV